jgi:UDP-MurNAc hydroxylase
MPWEDFFLSLRFRAWRDPDLYNDHMLGLLKFAHGEALDAVERYETSMTFDERITVHADDGTAYRIQRYCPHAGNDLLESGEVLPGGIVRCLAHHYEFSLETGACTNTVCRALEVERVGRVEEVAVEGAPRPVAAPTRWPISGVDAPHAAEPQGAHGDD